MPRPSSTFGAGVPLSVRRYNGPGNKDNEAYAVGVDANGNVFVTGKSWNGASDGFATVRVLCRGGGAVDQTVRRGRTGRRQSLRLSRGQCQ